MLTRALAIPDSALAGYTSTTFKDTTGYGWAISYLGFSQSKGIMLGDGAGNVMPGRTITVNEAVTMALRAIGYSQNSALLVGAWPANYVSIAQNESLYDDVATDTTVTRASAAQIIYNLLTVQKVAVNADGDTNFLTTKNDNDDTIEANLLNTNLGATAGDKTILGDEISYDQSLINISGKIGAYGTPYTNDDGDLIAFDVDSTALTGTITTDLTQFKVGTTKYDFATDSALSTTGDAIVNGDAAAVGAVINAAYVDTFRKDGTKDDDGTVTINVDLSGKKIKDVYSVVGWVATQNDQAASDVQTEISDDQTLLGEEFVLDDDDNIDLSQFQLAGAATLSDIAEDDVVYVYSDGNGDIRKVAVGTETVEGTVAETDSDTVTIDGKDYDIAKLAADTVLKIPADVDVDSEGTFYLDNYGKVYAFDGTSSNPDTFALVKAGNDETAFDNMKLKLYLSDDSTKTLYLNDSAKDINWTTPAGMSLNVATNAAVTAGKLLGYSLDADGDIDALDMTATSGSITFQSSKVLEFGASNKNYSIDSDAVVFFTNADGDYDVASLSDVKTDVQVTGQIMLNDDNKVCSNLRTCHCC